jgi:hypothetical protein
MLGTARKGIATSATTAEAKMALTITLRGIANLPMM